MLLLSPLLTLVTLLDRARAADRVAAAAHDDVPGVVGRAAAGRRGRRRRRRGGHRRAGREGLRPGGPRARHASADAADGLYGSRVRIVRIQARYTSLLQAIPALGQVGVLALGGWLAIHGQITLGTFLAFSTYLVQLLAPVRMFAEMLAVAQQARAGAERIFELLDSNPLVTEQPDARDARRRPTARSCSTHVTFGYLRSEPVLRDFTLRVAPGETVALVGASGSGKSTVAPAAPPLLRRAARRRPHRRRRRPRRHARLAAPRDRRRVRGRFLFSDSVRANIAYGRPDATDDEVDAAAAVAGAHEFIVALPRRLRHRRRRARASRCRAASASASRSPGPCSPTRACSCSTTPPRRSTRRTEEEIHATLRELMARPHDDPHRPPPLDAAPRRPHRRRRRRPRGRRRAPTTS